MKNWFDWFRCGTFLPPKAGAVYKFRPEGRNLYTVHNFGRRNDILSFELLLLVCSRGSDVVDREEVGQGEIRACQLAEGGGGPVHVQGYR